MSLKIRFSYKELIFFRFLSYALLLIFVIEASEAKSFREPAKYCGSKLTKQLHDFCETFYGPSADHGTNYAITDECCKEPCSLLYIVLSYCKKPKHKALANVFGKSELKLYRNLKQNITGTVLDEIKINGSALVPPKKVRKKKHVRRNKRTCACEKNRIMEEKKVKMLLSRKVPKHNIGIADYYESEPLLIANSI
ncbi:unnamed protein product [Ceutorhynchus assimilis]|uniref:Insulin-like domain-containing protein n=1 Tax=Ceutorhynchus assimilis TaxID=467358 RepID=A0A9N9MPC6_9CUCU|nr:unnamed protein product [Ceutorhynchus assimilis]